LPSNATQNALSRFVRSPHGDADCYVVCNTWFRAYSRLLQYDYHGRGLPYDYHGGFLVDQQALPVFLVPSGPSVKYVELMHTLST